jgi:hypothetical protein
MPMQLLLTATRKVDGPQCMLYKLKSFSPLLKVLMSTRKAQKRTHALELLVPVPSITCKNERWEKIEGFAVRLQRT